jgi:hypothetical protein
MPTYFFLKEDTTSMAMIVNNWVDWFSYIWEGVLRTAMEGFCLKKKNQNMNLSTNKKCGTYGSFAC